MLRLPAPAMAELTNAFRADLPIAWRRARDRHPDQTPYAFVLHGSEGGERPQVWPVILTEQGLDHVAQRYLDKGHHDTLDEARDALRWAVPDAPDAYEWVNGLPTVDAAIAEFIGTDVGDATGYQWLADAAVPAWGELDAAGLFGTGAQRERLLLGFMLFDVAKDETMGTVPLLNPPAVVERYRAQTEIVGHFQSVDGLAISSDGTWIYTVGSTKDPAALPGDDDADHDHNASVYEVVKHGIVDGRPVRRWWKRYVTGLGDSLGAITIDPSDGSVVVVRRRVSKDAGQSTLIRFAADSPDPVHEASCPIGPIAIAADGQVAVGGVDIVSILDRQFTVLRTLRVHGEVRAIAWRPSGELVIGGQEWVRVIDPVSGETVASRAIESDRTAIAPDGSTAAYTRWPWRSFMEQFRNTYPQVETAVTVFGGADLSSTQAWKFPGLILGPCTIAPGGRLATVEGNHIGSKRRSLIAVDLATGQELARRRLDLADRAAFLPDGRTVVLGKSEIGTEPPIELWTIRQ